MLVSDSSLPYGFCSVLSSIRTGYSIDGVCTHINAAADRFLATRPQIVIVNISSNGLQGFEAIESIQNLDGMVQFIVVSEYADFCYAREAIERDVSSYLTFPVSEKRILQSLEKAAARYEKSVLVHSAANVVNFNPDVFGRSAELGVDGAKAHICDFGDAASKPIVRKAINRIKHHYSEHLTLENVASELYVSSRHLSREFKLSTGKTFVEYLTDYRMKEAENILKDGTNRVYEVSRMVGYKSVNYFCRIFKEYSGMTPQECRNGLN